ncbi:metallopeptidase TldD-related protein [Nonomuraea sp. NBC_01738]|uniref:metallopeptidase TldD-related protein n=1 Tax=Nonomuraea sp. NBC_01738 TaxID=2976003 RepID=UPI002E0EDAEA|nr:metallopeptidase TldD-related protein [Nonomuraea sp. NBC_01738]
MTPQEMVEKALELSGADDCVVIADEGSTANLRFAGNTLTTNGVARSAQLTVISIVAGAVGVVSRSAVRADQLAEVVAAADAAARAAQPAEDARPLVRDVPASPHWGEPVVPTDIGVFERFAPALGETFAAAETGGRLLYGFAEHSRVTTFLGTSAGLRLRHDQPTGRFELNAKAAADSRRSAWTGVATRDFTDVDVIALDAELATRLEWSKNRIDLPAGRYETLLPPSAVADLLIYAYWSAGARDALDGRTVYARRGGGTRVGEKLAGLPITMRSDPSAAGVACEPFVVARSSGRDSSVFDNGLPLEPTDWVAEGTLSSLLQTRYSAELSGLEVTPGIDNLLVEGGRGASLGEMIASTERGLLLTCLWYIRVVDPQTLLVTGLTRDGVYLVENGEVVGEVNNFRFNESPIDLLGRVTEVGTAQQTLPREWSDYFTRAVMPPMRVPDFNMSTVSQAS